MHASSANVEPEAAGERAIYRDRGTVVRCMEVCELN